MNRSALLPTWLRPFIWGFMIFALLLPVLVLLYCLGYGVIPISMYGLSFDGSVSFPSIAVLAIFVFKGYVAYNLWKERDGAVGLGQIDAWIGIVACVVMMIYTLFVQSNSSIVMFSLRFELLFLIPYVWVMNRIAYDWG